MSGGRKSRREVSQFDHVQGVLGRALLFVMVAVLVTSSFVGVVTPVAAVEGDPVVVEPSEEWTTLLGGTRVDSVVETSNGDFLTAQSPSVGVVQLLRVDATGAPVAGWPKTYTVNTATVGEPQRVIATADGGYAVAGTSPFYVLKLDAAANVEWLYEGVPRKFVYDFIQTNDGGFVAVGDTTANQAMYATKVDAIGAFEWTQTASDLNAPSARGVVEAEGAYAVTGKVNPKPGRNPFFMRLDPDTGTRIAFSDTTLTRVYTDSPYYGVSFDNVVYDGSQHVVAGWGPIDQSSSKGYLVVLDTDGADTVLGQYTGGNVLTDLDLTTDGFVLTGYNYPQYAWVLKTDRTGVQQWEKLLTNPGTASGYLVGAAVDQTSEEGYILAGFTVSGSTTVEPFLTRFGPDLDVVDVTVSTPTDGAIIGTDTVILSGTATSTLGTVSSVEVSAGGTVVGTAPVTSGPWTFDYTATTDGPYTLIVSATDDLGASDTETVSVTVDTTAPTFDSATVSPSPVAGGDPVTVTAQVSDATTEVSSVSALVQGQSFLKLVPLTETSLGEWTGTFTAPLSSETLTVDISVSDVAGNTALTTRTVTVDATAPTISSVEVTPDVVQPGATVDVTATVTDESGVSSVLAEGVSLSDTDADDVWNGSLTAPLTDGAVTVEVVATDAVGNTATDTSASYTVDGTGPVLSLSVPSTSPTTSVEVSGSVSDTNGIVSAELVADEGSSSEQTITLASGSFTETLALSAGAHTITLRATDTVGNTAETSVTVVVDLNAPPVADAGADQTVSEFSTVTLDATGSVDPDDDPLTYQWTQTDGPAVILTGADTATPTFAAPGVDTPNTLALTFAVTVSDGVESDTDEVIVTVEPIVYAVEIDVDPQDVDNNVSTKGVIRVVLYGDENVAASDIVVESLRFGNESAVDNGGGAAPGNGVQTRDVDGDGREDLVVRFKADASGLVPGDTLAVLVGDLVDGTELRGTDPVTVDAPGPG